MGQTIQRLQVPSHTRSKELICATTQRKTSLFVPHTFSKMLLTAVYSNTLKWNNGKHWSRKFTCLCLLRETLKRLEFMTFKSNQTLFFQVTLGGGQNQNRWLRVRIEVLYCVHISMNFRLRIDLDSSSNFTSPKLYDLVQGTSQVYASSSSSIGCG